MDIAQVAWRKSTRSGGHESNACVEVGDRRLDGTILDTILVRDTKHHGAGPTLAFPRATWTAFLTDVKAGRHNLP